MRVLIDGYNLLFSLGMVPTPVQEGDLYRARQQLLEMLIAGLGEQAKNCTVVLDATRSPRRSPGDGMYRGIDVRFTERREEADDLIAWLIKQCPVPKQLIVISSDHRLVEAATRKRATSIKAQQFLEWLERQQSPAPSSPPSTVVSREEQARWMQTFAGIDEELTDVSAFPEESWTKGIQIDDDELDDDPKTKHRMKPK
jgi:predicted RNA-binding protein with PIN domain